MKWKHKIPEFDSSVNSTLMDAGWTRLKEPDSLVKYIVSSIPFMFIILGSIVMFLALLSDWSFADFGINAYSNDDGFGFALEISPFVILVTIAIVFIHELIHLVIIPDFLKSDNTFIGLTLWGGFVYTSETISRNRYLCVSVTPFIIISIALPIICMMFGMMNGLIAYIVVLNGVGASVDIYGVWLMLRQIPSNSLIINNGTAAYWRLKR